MPALSIIITAHNEPPGEIPATIASIRLTAGTQPEIIVVDDASQLPVGLDDKQVKLIRTEERCGVGPARHIGATHATAPLLLILDAHMRFEPGWFETALSRIKDRPYTIHNAACVALEPGQMDMRKAKAVYHGATLNLYGPDKHKPNVMQVLEGNWLPDKDGDDYPMACIMGANYFIPTDWFFHIGGLRLLRGWGGDEPLLALKTWLAGGECRMLKSVRIGHQFRESSVYSTMAWNMIYNKMMIALTCLPLDMAYRLNRLHQGSGELVTAKDRIREDWGLLMTERRQLDEIFVRSFQWYLTYFGLNFPA